MTVAEEDEEELSVLEEPENQPMFCVRLYVICGCGCNGHLMFQELCLTMTIQGSKEDWS